jgi:hypothetical protein
MLPCFRYYTFVTLLYDIAIILLLLYNIITIVLYMLPYLLPYFATDKLVLLYLYLLLHIYH